MKALDSYVSIRAPLAGLLSVLAASFFSPLGATDFLVDSTADLVDVNPGDGVCDADPGAATVCTLRAAVQEANALAGVDRIGLLGGVYTLAIAGRDEDLAATGDLDLTESAQLLGDPADPPTINGGGLDRIFDLHGSSSTAYVLAYLTLRNGHAVGAGVAGSGGAVRSFHDGSFGMTDCIVRNNEADVGGGGIHSEGSTVAIGRSLIEGNSAETGAGAWLRFGRAFVSATVRGNIASSSGGGVAATSGDSSDYLYLYQSSIVGNEAPFGAGIDTGMRSLAVNTVVADNAGSYGSGGAIRTFSTLTISSSTIFGNRVASEEVAGIALAGGSSSLTLDHTILAGNTNQSGAADCGGSLVSEGYNLVGSTAGCTLTGSTTGNQLDIDPQLIGPVYLRLNSGTAGGRPAWVPRNAAAPSVDAGDPAGAYFDHDADAGTAEVLLDEDLWDRDRPNDGDLDTVVTTDIGAVESTVILVDDFETGDGCSWSLHSARLTVPLRKRGPENSDSRSVLRKLVTVPLFSTSASDSETDSE